MQHYVYVGKVDGVIKYVGMGKGVRHAHLNSGTSSCYAANKHHFEGGKTDVEVITQFLDEKDARELERFIIGEVLPEWNTIKPGMKGTSHGCLGQNYKRDNSTSQYLGVSKSKTNKKNPWRAWHRTDGRKDHIGNYSSEICAAMARDKYLLDNALPGVLNF